jgi:hypothetical protein
MDRSAKQWLLLIHQLPAKPAYFRVKIWRKLLGLGAVAIKNAVYALPSNEEMREDFEWLLREITEGGGEAVLCEARLLDGLSDEQMRALFDGARDAEYDEIAKDVRALAKALAAAAMADDRAEAREKASRLRRRFAGVAAIDFFDANGRETVEGLLSAVEAQVREESVPPNDVSHRSGPKTVDDLLGRTWVTRQGVHVDRIASAWLLRRFLDPQARFKFVPGKEYEHHEDEVRFDMFEAKFTHEGDNCTFEVLLARIGINDPALRAIADIVHDIDLKDDKFAREETAGIKTLIAGIGMATDDDEERLTRGAAIFDDLYAYFGKKRR